MKKQSISALLAQVMYLANEANEKTDKCVFVSYSGHVHGLEIHITPTKDRYIDRVAEANIYHVDEKEKHLKNIIRNLQYLVDHGELDNDRLTEIPVVTTHYEHHM